MLIHKQKIRRSSCIGYAGVGHDHAVPGSAATSRDLACTCAGNYACDGAGASRPGAFAGTCCTICTSVARRAQREPLAYILGHQVFYGLDFLVDRRVLVPRHETETLVQLALDACTESRMPFLSLSNVGTGSGVLALTLAHHLPTALIWATDISPDALTVAQMNVARLNLAGRVPFVHGDLLEPLDERFDLLMSNLPYIPSTDMINSRMK